MNPHEPGSGWRCTAAPVPRCIPCHRGEQGPIGKQGPTGEKGQPGDRGEKGLIGEQGLRGEKGHARQIMGP